MVKRPRTLLSGLCVALTACLTGGCSPQLPPSEEAVVYYFRNARLLHFRTGKSDGEVRRLWPQGQEYVNAVLKADAQLQKKLNPLRELNTPLSHWPREDPRWQEETELTKQLSTRLEHVEGDKAEREMLLGKLGEAIEKTPADLELATPDAQAAFVARVWDALAIHGADLRGGAATAQLEEAAAGHLRLFRAVWSCTDDFDTDQSGLRFKDASHQQTIDGHYNALQQLLAERRATFVRHAEQTLSANGARLKTINKREEKSEYEYLTHQNTYLRTELEMIPRDLQTLIDTTQEELEQLQDKAAKAKLGQKNGIDAEINSRMQRIEELKVEKELWKARVDAILKRASDAAGHAAAADEYNPRHDQRLSGQFGNHAKRPDLNEWSPPRC